MKLITGLFKPTNAFRTVGKLAKTGLTKDELSLVSSAEEMPAFIEGEPADLAATGAAVGAVAGGAAGALGAWVTPAIPGFEAMFASGMLTTAAGRRVSRILVLTHL
jgi:hypothetical protein